MIIRKPNQKARWNRLGLFFHNSGATFRQVGCIFGSIGILFPCHGDGRSSPSTSAIRTVEEAFDLRLLVMSGSWFYGNSGLCRNRVFFLE